MKDGFDSKVINSNNSKALILPEILSLKNKTNHIQKPRLG